MAIGHRCSVYVRNDFYLRGKIEILNYFFNFFERLFSFFEFPTSSVLQPTKVDFYAIWYPQDDSNIHKCRPIRDGIRVGPTVLAACMQWFKFTFFIPRFQFLALKISTILTIFAASINVRETTVLSGDRTETDLHQYVDKCSHKLIIITVDLYSAFL